jgi:enoyl-CoA hydratase/carnithine racemase
MPIAFEMRGHIAVITLDEPARRNALSRALVRGLFDALARSVNEHARAIVIAANGPAFCAGANISDLRDGWMEGKVPETDPVGLFRALVEDPRIVIGAIQGPALGGGFELALCCDLVVAEESAWFSLPELSHGVIPNTGLARLQQIVGMRQAAEMIFTRRRIDVKEARACGLVNDVAGAGEALNHAIALAEQIVSRAPPGAIAAAKRNLQRHAKTDWDAVQSSLREVPAREWQEGLDSFSEKRPPDYARFWLDRTISPRR